MLDEILTLTRDVCAYASACTRRLATFDKADKSPVTIADVGIQVLVHDFISRHHPTDQVISEEERKELPREFIELAMEMLVEVNREYDFGQFTKLLDYAGDEHARHRWYIDPIDGTKGFLRREQYATAIARYQDNKPLLGCLICPNLPFPNLQGQETGTLFYWAAGSDPVQISLTNHDIREPLGSQAGQTAMLQSVESRHGDFAVNEKVMKKLAITKTIAVDSQAKYGLLARGEGSVYLRVLRDKQYQEKAWDHAAGAALVSASGGTVTNLDGQPLHFGELATIDSGNGILATRDVDHQKVLDALPH